MKFKKLLLLICSISVLSGTLSSCDVGEAFKSVVDKVTEVGGDAIETIKDWGSDAWKKTVDWGSDTWNDVSSWGQSAWQQVADWSSNAGEAVAKWGEAAINGAKNFFCNVGDYIINIANNVVTFGLKKGVEKLDLTKGFEENGTYDDWKEYTNDYEAITYSLISTQLKKIYDVFPAKLVLPTSKQEVYGYCFTDYGQTFVSSQDSETQEIYYSSGFVSLVDEFTISKTEAEKGIEIFKLESNDTSNAHYFYSYRCEPFTTHCVIRGQYLKYGVNSDNQIFYENSEYDGKFDKELGGLYSFDEKKYLYGEDNGFVPKKGNIIDESFDFIDWKEQTKTTFISGLSLKLSDLKKLISNAVFKTKQVINNINEQTILGYNLKDIKNAVNGTHEDDIATVTQDKIALHSVDNEVPSTPSSTAKWICGICAGIAVIADLTVALFFPKVTPANIALNVAVGTISGSAIELMLEVIMNNKSFKDVNWIKVGIAAIAGGLASLVPANSSKKYVISTSLITAFTNMSYAFLDGQTIFNSAISFISSFAIAILLSTATISLFNGLGKMISKVAPKFTKKVSTFIANHQIIIGGKSMKQIPTTAVDGITRQASASADASSVDQRKTVFNTKSAVKQLPGSKNKYFAIVDDAGHEISKAQLLKNGGNGYLSLKKVEGGNKYSILFIDRSGNPLSRVPIKNGYIQFQYFDSTIVSLRTSQSLVANRSENFKMFDECLKRQLINSPSSVSNDVLTYFRTCGKDFDDLTFADFKYMRTILNKTWHEGENRATGILIDTTLHQVISHMGGFSLAKALAAFSFPSQILFALEQTIIVGA